MEGKTLSELTDQELLAAEKKQKSASIVNALLIGMLIGIIVYGVVDNGFGFFMVIPLFFIYRLANKEKYNKGELERLLKERNLKR